MILMRIVSFCTGSRLFINCMIYDISYTDINSLLVVVFCQIHIFPKACDRDSLVN